jgi:general secretion pathway protein J
MRLITSLKKRSNLQLNSGFTLVELLVAMIIFAFISVVSYRIISTIVLTNEVAGASQEKWGNLSLAMSNLRNSWTRIMPLVVRDENGNVLPALSGKEKLSGMFDSQVEMSVSGFIGDQIYGTTPPKRIGFRFNSGSLYLVTWPVLNRVLTTKPEINLLLENVKTFNVNFLYPDGKWRPIWPAIGADPTQLPSGMTVEFSLNSGESIIRTWAL